MPLEEEAQAERKRDAPGKRGMVLRPVILAGGQAPQEDRPEVVHIRTQEPEACDAGRRFAQVAEVGDSGWGVTRIPPRRRKGCCLSEETEPDGVGRDLQATGNPAGGLEVGILQAEDGDVGVGRDR